MANGIMQLRQSDTDELRITKINQNFLALLNSLGKGFSGFSLDNNNTGYYNALINRLEYDNVYADRFGAYIASADYLNVGTAWFNSASFQKAIADSLDVNSLIARTIKVNTVTAGEAEVDLLHALYLQSTQAEFTEAQATILNSSLITAGNGVFQYIRSGGGYITSLNADYIKVGTLSFDHIIGKVGDTEAFGEWEEIYDDEGEPYDPPQYTIVFKKQVGGALIENDAVGLDQLVSRLVGRNGYIDLDNGTFSFFTPQVDASGEVVVDPTSGDPVVSKQALSWDGSNLLVSLDSALIKFIGKDAQAANNLNALIDNTANINTAANGYSELSQNVSGAQSDIEQIKSWISISQTGIVLGEIENSTTIGASTLELTPTEVKLTYMDTVATLTGAGLSANQGIFANAIRIGDFVFEQRANLINNLPGHLSLKYVG